MPFDAHKNLAISEVAVAPAAITDTTLTVLTGGGAFFPTPPFNATVWPKALLPTPTNAEIIRVTASAGDAFTIERGQEGTTPRNIMAGDLIAATITALSLTDIEDGTRFPVIVTGPVSASLLDLRAGAGVPPNPPVNTARLYPLVVNGFPQVEMIDSNANVVRFASDNIAIVKVTVAVARGQALFIAGASGANALVGLAQSDAIATMPAIGVALDDGAANGFVRALLAGTIQKVNTSAFNEGDSLFVSPTVAGGLTTVLPVVPNYAQRVGFVTRKHASQGEVLVMTTAVAGPPRLHAPTHAIGGTDPVVKVMRQGHTWGLVGDVTPLSVLPPMWVQLAAAQTTKIIGLIAKIVSGTSITVQLKRNGANVAGGVYVATPTTNGVALDVALAHNDELTLALSAPVGAPTTLGATVLLEHTF